MEGADQAIGIAVAVLHRHLHRSRRFRSRHAKPGIVMTRFESLARARTKTGGVEKRDRAEKMPSRCGRRTQRKGSDMERNNALRILNALANGVHPATGEVFAADSPYSTPIRCVRYSRRYGRSAARKTAAAVAMMTGRRTRSCAGRQRKKSGSLLASTRADLRQSSRSCTTGPALQWKHDC